MVDSHPYRFTYYRLKQTDLNGDYSYSQTIAIAIPGIEIITLYPNPVSDNFQYTISSSDNTEVKISVIDMLGRKVVEKNSAVTQGLSNHNMDVSKISNGSYLLQIITNKGLYKSQIQFSVK